MAKKSKLLTDRFIASVKPIEGKSEVEHFDSRIGGFCLRVGNSGTKSWRVYYRTKPKDGIASSRKKMTLGKYPLIGLADARKAATDVLNRVDAGEDPAKEKQDEKHERILRVASDAPKLLEEGLRKFVEDHVRAKHKPRIKADGSLLYETEWMLERYVYPSIGDMPLADFTRRHLLELKRSVEKSGAGRMAERVAGAVRTGIYWLDKQEMLDFDPPRLEIEVEKKQRHRVLADGEIRQLWQHLGQSPFDDIVRLLLLTGQRRSEVAGMCWSELGDLSNKEWNIPEARTKNGLPHVVPLSDLVVSILKRQKKIGDCDFVFTRTGKTPFSGYSRSKSRLDDKVGIDHWTLHDLRRSFVTHMSNGWADPKDEEKMIGAQPPHIVEATVHHVSGDAKKGVAGIYNKAEYLPQRAEALRTWSKRVLDIVGEGAKEVGNVIYLEDEKAG